SPVLVEFPGGSKVNATINKEAYDINKLYSNMISIIADLPDNISKTMFCARFYDDNIYFEELFAFEESYFRKIRMSFCCSTTPRLLVNFTSQIPQILRWKEAVINQKLQFQD
ncbi:uncharacterized protein BX663DRAFT_427493, partial [Cokeromyces recurvatus]|uniref:uncharacterized protein n=1 Tax=Cokeromyces recurvatus TaxID=90255 RepID=UPI00221EDFF6